MKKILYIVSTLKQSGPTNQLSYIIKYLDKNNFQAMILTLSSESNDSMIEYFEQNFNIKIDSLNLSRITSTLKGTRKIKEYIEEYDIDIIHSQGIRADGLIKNIDIKKISTLRNYPYYDYPPKFGRLKGGLMVFNHMSTIKSNVENCIACAKSISYEFKRNGLSLPYIQNGVDTDKFMPLNKEDKINLRTKLNIDNTKKIFITVGSLIPRKDVKTVINGFNLYNKKKDSILIIAGNGFEKDNLIKISNDDIIFLGNISNVVEYLQISDYFVSASLAEGLPNTVLEAMACGLSTMLSDIPSHKELYEKEEGSFFTIGNVNELEKLLAKATVDIKAQKETSLRLIKENFSAKSMSEKYQEIYKEKINESI